MPWEIVVEDSALRAGLAAAPKRLDDELRQGVTQGAVILHDAVVRNTPVGATGMLRNSITFEVSGSGLDVTGRVFSTDVPVKVASVETGRAPGRMPPWGPGSSLSLWVARKAGGDQRAAFLIARAIGRRGTKGAHMFERAYSANRAKVVSLLEEAVRRGLGGLR